jgi:hypothetical protein
MRQSSDCDLYCVEMGESNSQAQKEKFSYQTAEKNLQKSKTKVILRMTPFCDVVLCSLVEVDRRFRGSYCLHHQDTAAVRN